MLSGFGAGWGAGVGLMLGIWGWKNSGCRGFVLRLPELLVGFEFLLGNVVETRYTKQGAAM